MGHARNAINILSSQVVIACGMGPGTASEVALALKSGKPTLLLKPDDASRQFFYNLSNGQVQVSDHIVGAIDWIRNVLAIA